MSDNSTHWQVGPFEGHRYRTELWSETFSVNIGPLSIGIGINWRRTSHPSRGGDADE